MSRVSPLVSPRIAEFRNPIYEESMLEEIQPDGQPTVQIALGSRSVSVSKAAEKVKSNGDAALSSQPMQKSNDGEVSAKPMEKITSNARRLADVMVRDLQTAGSDAMAMGLGAAKAYREKRPISLEQAAVVIFVAFIVVEILLMLLIRPNPWYMATFTVIGLGMGLAFSLLYYRNKQLKAESRQVVRDSLLCERRCLLFHAAA